MINKIQNILGSGWSGIKYSIKQLWHFIEVEIPELMSNWRLVPRLLMLAYGWAFLDVINWFMALENPNNAQAGLVSVAGSLELDAAALEQRLVGGRGREGCEVARGHPDVHVVAKREDEGVARLALPRHLGAALLGRTHRRGPAREASQLHPDGITRLQPGLSGLLHRCWFGECALSFAAGQRLVQRLVYSCER